MKFENNKKNIKQNFSHNTKVYIVFPAYNTILISEQIQCDLALHSE